MRTVRFLIICLIVTALACYNAHAGCGINYSSYGYNYYPSYSYSYPVYYEKKVVVQEYVPTPFALFQFVAPPTTPAPVLVAAPPAPVATASASVGYNQAAAAAVPCAQAAAAPCAQAATAAVPCATEQRLARIEAALTKLATLTATGMMPEANHGTYIQPTHDASEERIPEPPPSAPAPPQANITQADGARIAMAQQHCAQCHTGANARDNVQLFNDQGYWQPNVSEEEIWRAVRSGKMPKTPNKLTTAQANLFRPKASSRR